MDEAPLAVPSKSPYASLSHAELVEMAARHDAAVERLVEESRRMQAQVRAQAQSPPCARRRASCTGIIMPAPSGWA